MCVQYAFANAVLLLLDEKGGTGNLMRLPRDVFDLMIDSTELCYEEFYHDESSKGASQIPLPRSWKKIGLNHFAQFLRHKWGKQMMTWANAPSDGSYDQIKLADLVCKPYTQSSKWSAEELHDNLLKVAAIFIVEITAGHHVCVDTVHDRPLIYETDASFTHAIPWSVHNILGLGWSAKRDMGGEVREVRLRFASGKQAPPLASRSKKRKRKHNGKKPKNNAGS